MVEHQTTKSGSGVTYQPQDTHGYPGGGGVVFRKDPGQLESRSVSVPPEVPFLLDNLRVQDMMFQQFLRPLMAQNIPRPGVSGGRGLAHRLPGGLPGGSLGGWVSLG